MTPRATAALLVLVLAAVACSSPSTTQTPRASGPDGDLAQDFTLPTLNGGEFTLSDHRGKQPVVLKFWAPW